MSGQQKGENRHALILHTQLPSQVLLTNAMRFSDCTFLAPAVDRQPPPLLVTLFSDTLSSFCSYNLPSKSLALLHASPFPVWDYTHV